ncbi:MAG TPA: N-acetyl-gamma-glutamyl-phosphate reductase [Phycisphaerales bacterium]|nr:N-acetyl-gamma-glutamyl-phosphate reductase [Phycisphaerales bacterium]
MTKNSESPIPIAIVGAGGYTGAELIEIALRHPSARIAGLFGSGRSDSPASIVAMHPRFGGRIEMDVRAGTLDAIAGCGAKAVFLATPHEVSHELAPALVECGIVVIDLSAAFRLKDAMLYPKHYGFTHGHVGVLERVPYGLPELSRGAIAKAMLIAVPGCYPTSAILPLAPLVRAGAVALGTRPIIDATSGVSGAGRTPSMKNLFSEVSQHAYNVLSHRHQPEIDAYAGCETIFTAHLGPYDRGILSTIHVELAAGWDEQRVRSTLEAAYAHEPFVRVNMGRWPSVNSVKHTNFCDIGIAVESSRRDRGHLIMVSAIDNLVKGASGQAVQCFNVRFEFEETMGLGIRHQASGIGK